MFGISDPSRDSNMTSPNYTDSNGNPIKMKPVVIPVNNVDLPPPSTVLLPSIGQTAFILTPVVSHDTLVDCQDACSASSECSGCQQMNNVNKFASLSNGQIVSDKNVYVKVDIDTPGQCRQQCWVTENCYAYSWGRDDTGTHCNLITHFDGVSMGVSARMGGLEAQGCHLRKQQQQRLQQQ